MKNQAIIFGAGNIGRGFIGQLFSESGYHVTFVDVDDELVEALNARGAYRLETVFHDDVQEYRIGPVRAIHGKNVEEVAEALAAATLGATAVGAGALRFIAPAIARGIILRAQRSAPPFNLIVCENLKGAAATLRDLVREHVPDTCLPYFEREVGFVDTVIGRMVPMPTAEMRARDVSAIRTEPYKELPVDRTGFRGDIPAVVAMDPRENFSLYTARKLYIHNCGHALLAYTGYLHGYEYGYEALADEALLDFLRRGLDESVAGIVHRYACPRPWLEEHVRDLLQRFGNRLLADTIFRLGRDPRRKLSPTDRLVGAANLAAETGKVPQYLAWGIAAGLCFDPADDPAACEIQADIAARGMEPVLADITGIDPASPLGTAVLRAYALLREDPQALPDPADR